MAHPARTASLIVLLASAAALPVAGQTDARPRFEVGVTYTTNLLEDENGTTVSYGIAPAIGAGYAWTLTPNTNGVIGARVSRAGVDVELGGNSNSAGNGWVIDARGVLERSFGPCGIGAPGCIAVHAGAGAVWVSGPDDVAPFSTDRGAMLTGEAGLAVRLTRGRPLFLTGAAQLFRLGGTDASDPIEEAGTVTRILVGLRHGR